MHDRLRMTVYDNHASALGAESVEALTAGNALRCLISKAAVMSWYRIVVSAELVSTWLICF